MPTLRFEPTPAKLNLDRKLKALARVIQSDELKLGELEDAKRRLKALISLVDFEPAQRD
jgi:hypothetical protein